MYKKVFYRWSFSAHNFNAVKKISAENHQFHSSELSIALLNCYFLGQTTEKLKLITPLIPRARAISAKILAVIVYIYIYLFIYSYSICGAQKMVTRVMISSCYWKSENSLKLRSTFAPKMVEFQ